MTSKARAIDYGAMFCGALTAYFGIVAGCFGLADNRYGNGGFADLRQDQARGEDDEAE